MTVGLKQHSNLPLLRLANANYCFTSTFGIIRFLVFDLPRLFNEYPYCSIKIGIVLAVHQLCVLLPHTKLNLGRLTIVHVRCQIIWPEYLSNSKNIWAIQLCRSLLVSKHWVLIFITPLGESDWLPTLLHSLFKKVDLAKKSSTNHINVIIISLKPKTTKRLLLSCSDLNIFHKKRLAN